MYTVQQADGRRHIEEMLPAAVELLAVRGGGCVVSNRAPCLMAGVQVRRLSQLGGHLLLGRTVCSL